MQKPNLKDYAVALAPIAASAAIIATPLLLGSASDPNGIKLLVEAVGTNLLSDGLAALCKPGRLFASKEYQERLANHDIVRLVRMAWGEASDAAVKAYTRAHPFRSPEALSILSSAPPKLFTEILLSIEPDDFVVEIDAAVVRGAIENARRSLLADGLPATATDTRISEQVAILRDSMVDLMVATVRNLYGSEPPASFRTFLESEDLANGRGILGLLCDYVALHLGSDERAQVALLHFSLQDLVDDQHEIGQRLETLRTTILESQSELERSLLHAFELRLKTNSELIKQHVHSAVNRLVTPTLDPPFSAYAAAGPDFTYRARATHLIGRTGALETLKQFMDDPRPGLWTVISGPAGTGKSRLAAELIALVRAPGDTKVLPGFWRAGFLSSCEQWLSQQATKWRPDADTLIAIDYASGNDVDALASFLVRLNRIQGPLEVRVRVVLIDRLSPDSDLGVATLLRRGRDSASDLDATRWKSSEPGSDKLALQSLQNEDALEVVRLWAGSRWSLSFDARIRQAIAEDAELGRPLFAALMGDAIASSGFPAGHLNPVSVARAVLDRLSRKQALSAPNQVRKAEILVASATAAQGIADRHLFDDETLSLIFDHGISDDLLLNLKDGVRSLSGAHSDGRVPAIEPDFLGGLFVLSCLAPLGERRGSNRAKSLMSIAWRYGGNPGGFLVRLASDFIARADQLAVALARDGERPAPDMIRELLLCLCATAASDDAIPRAGTLRLPQLVYIASKAGEIDSARRLLQALQERYRADQSEAMAEVLVVGWFALALFGDLPASTKSQRREAMEEIRHLSKNYGTAAMALWEAKALFSQGRIGSDVSGWVVAAEQIGEVRERHDTPEIALEQARALANATGGQGPHFRDAMVQKIAELREQHDTPEMAFEQARALFNGTVGEVNPRLREAKAQEIGKLREQHDTAEIALEQARALVNATFIEPDGLRSEAMAGQVGKLRERHDTAEIALEEAMALVNASRDADPRRMEAVAEQIGRTRKRHDTAAIAHQQAKALANACQAFLIPIRGWRRAMAERIAEVRQCHDTPDIALEEARALATAVMDVFTREIDPSHLKAIAEQIGELCKRHDTPEIAFYQAQTIRNANTSDSEPRAVATQISELRKRHDTPEIAALEALQLSIASANNSDPRWRRAIAHEIGELRQRHNTLAIASHEAVALYNASLSDPEPSWRQAVAEQTAELLHRYDSLEIANVLVEVLKLAATVETTQIAKKRYQTQIDGLVARLGLHNP